MWLYVVRRDGVMALVKCPECGKEISDSALACPHCGCLHVSVDISNVSNFST